MRHCTALAAACAAFACAVSLPAQSMFVLDTNYSATNLSQFSSSPGNIIDYRNFWGVTWNIRSPKIGGFTSGLFGEEYGFEMQASTTGRVGLDVGFRANSGLLDVNLPNRISISVPSSAADQPILTISQDRSALGAANIVTTTFPQIELDLKARVNVDATLDARVAYGFGSASGSVSLSSLGNLIGGLTPNPLFENGLNPFNNSLNILSYNQDGNGELQVLFLPPKDLLGTDGLTVPIKSTDVTKVSSVPFTTTLGVVTVNPPHLDLASGNSLTGNGTQPVVLAVGLDIPGIMYAATGSPVNPYEPRIGIPGTPLEVLATLLSVDTNLGLGLRQEITLRPNTTLGLRSNYPVSYEWVNQQGVTQTFTGLDFLLPLNDDLSLSTLKITGKPVEADWQLFPRVMVQPTVNNRLYLTVQGYLDIIAGQIGIGAYGIGGGTPALFDQHVVFTPSGEILLYETTFTLTDPIFTRVHRFLTPIFGTASRDFTIEQGDFVDFSNQDGIFAASSIAGTLHLSNSLFRNEANLELSGKLLVSGNSTQAQFTRLDLTDDGVLQVTAGNTVNVIGEQDSQGNFVFDENLNRRPGFISPEGHLDHGTYLLQGKLLYTGPDVTRIGAGANVQLVAGGDFGPRLSHDGVDGLRKLSLLEGQLTLIGRLVESGADLALDQSLTNAGQLALLDGSTMEIAGNLGNQAGSKLVLGGGGSLTVSGALTNVSAGGQLSSVDLTLGGVLSYVGPGLTSLASGSSLHLSGARPAIGYLQASGGDAVLGLASNAGTFELHQGATQTLASHFANLHQLAVRDGSHLTLGGDYADSGTTVLAGGGFLTVGGTLTNLAESGGLRTLGGVDWDLAGALTYHGDTIQALGPDSVLRMVGSGRGLIRAGGNAFSDLSLVAGQLTLAEGNQLSSDSALDVTGSLQLEGANTLARFRGFAGASGSVSVLGGTLDTTGGAAHAAYWAANPSLSSLPVNGTGQLAFPTPFTMNGTLIYAGPLLSGIAAGSTVTINSPANIPVQTMAGANGFAGLSRIDGVLNTTGNLRTDTSLTIGATGMLHIGPGGVFRAAGTDFGLDPGGQLTLGGGSLALGGGPGATTFTIPDQTVFANGGAILLGAPQFTSDADGPHYLNPGTGGRLVANPGHAWTNENSYIIGAGEISGGTLTNRGLIEAGGGTLVLTGFDGPMVNTGVLSSFGSPSHPSRLQLEGVTLANSGLLSAVSTIALEQSSVTGGNIAVARRGTLEMSGSTITLDAFVLDGRLLVRDGTGSTITSAMTIRPGALLELAGGATPASLGFGVGSSLTNEGTISYGTGTDITGVTVLNRGRVVLGPNVATNLSNIENTIAGTIALGNGSTLTLSSSFANAGLVHLSGENPALLPNSSSTILLANDVTLTGGGNIQFGGFNTTTTAQVWDYGIRQFVGITVPYTEWTDAGSGVIRSDSGDRVLTIVDQTLTGRGNLGEGTLAIDNQAGGAIRVEGDGSVLNIAANAGGFRNRGRLDVGAGATMNLSGPFLSLSDGALTEGTYRVGGTLRIPGLAGGSFNTGVPIVFDGTGAQIINENDVPVTIGSILPAGSFVRVNGSTTFATSAGNPFTNSGLLGAGTGGRESFTPGDVVITGGYFTNFANQTLTGGNYEVAGTLRFDGADIRTNAADLTLRAEGRVEDEHGADALATLGENTGTLALRSRADYAVGAGVGTFSQRGSIRVDAGSTFDFASAAIDNVAADTPEYWVAGTLTGGTGFQTAGTWVTLYGPQALWTTGGTNFASRRNDGRLTFAGGYGATYSGIMTLFNDGLWEIGSSAVPGVDRLPVRSGASVAFEHDVIIQNTGTLRYYGGPTDDFSSGSFTILPNTLLTILEPGTLVSRFEATGTIAFGTGAELDLHGTFAVGNLPLTLAGGGALTITGGLEMLSPINFGTTAFNFTPLAGYPITLDGVMLDRPGLSLGPTNASVISLRNGARLFNTTTLRSSLETITLNTGSIELINTLAESFGGDFTNTGTMSGGQFNFAQSLTNSGSISASIDVGGNLDNTGAISGALEVGGNLVNEAGGTLALTAGQIGGDFYNNSTLHDLPNLRVGGTVTNVGTLTIRSHTFRGLDGVTASTIVNGETLYVAGSIFNPLVGPGDFRVADSQVTELFGTSTATGRWFVGANATLHIDGDSRLGAAPTLSVLPWVVLGESADLFLGGSLATHRSIEAGAGARIEATAPGVAVPGGITGLGDLTVAGELTTRLRVFNGNLTLEGALITTDGNSRFDATVSGSGNFANSGSHLLAFDGGATFEGTVSNSAAGTLEIGGTGFAADIVNDGAFNLLGGGAITLDGSLSGLGDLLIANNTAVTLTRASSQAGGTEISTGSSLTLDGLGALAGGITNHGNLTFAKDHHDVTVASAITGLGSVTKNDTGTLTFAADHTYAGTTTINDGTLRIADGGNIAGDIVNEAVLAIDRVSDFVLGSDLSGGGALTKGGSGALTLAGTNTYTGSTIVTEGTLRIGGDSALGAAPASFVADHLSLGNGSTLHLLAGTTLAANRGLATLGTVTISGSSLDVGTNLGGAGIINYAGGGTLTVGLGGNYTPHAFALTAANQLTLDNLGQDQAFASSLTGISGSLVRFQGAGTLSLQNTAPFGGNFQVAAGTTLRIGAGSTSHGFLGTSTQVFGTLELGRSDAVSYSGFAGDGTIIKDFAGTTTLANAGQFDGTLVLKAGVLEMSQLNLGTIDTFRAGGLTFDGGTLRITASGGGGSIDSNRGITITANHGVLDLPNGGSVGFGGAFAGSGRLTKTGTGTLDLFGGGTIPTAFRLIDGWLAHSGTNAATFAGVISDDFLNTGTRGGLLISHSLFQGDVTLTANNTYTGGTLVSGGVNLIVGDGGTSGAIVGDVQVFDQSYLAYDRSDSFVLPNSVTGAGGLKQLGSGTLTINSAQAFTGALVADDGTIRLTGAGSVAGDIVTNANLLLDFAGTTQVANDIGGTGAVSKSGAGTVTLGGDNSYSGLTNVLTGTLVLPTANLGHGGANVSNGATLRFADGGSLGGTIDLASGATLELDYSSDHHLAASFAGSGLIQKLGAGTAILTAAPNFGGSIGIGAGTLEFAANADGLVSGIISGAGDLTKSGTGTLTLTANNIFTGTTTINGGVLQLGNGGTDGRLTGPFVLNEGGTLAFNHSDVEFFGSVISGAGGIAQRGTGAFVLVADNTYTGGTAIGEGAALHIGAGGITGSILGSVANDGLLVFDRSDAHTFAGNTTGTGVLRQSGAGALTLTGQHSAAGGAVIDTGTTLALGTNATLTGPIENAGTLSILTAAGPDREIDVSINGPGAVNIAGGGTLRLEGDVNYAGATTFSDNSTLKLVTLETSILSNTLTGTGNLMKLGLGTLILTADSNLAGIVTIGQGTLQLGNGGATGTIGGFLNGSVDLAGGTLAINRSNLIDLFNPITGTGGLSQLGSGQVTLWSDNSFIGTTHVGAGAKLNLGTGGTTGKVLGPLWVDGTLAHNIQGNWAINGLIGFGTLQKFQPGSYQVHGETAAPVAFGGSIQYLGAGGPGSVAVTGDATLGTFSNIGAVTVNPGAHLTLIGSTSVFSMQIDNQGTLTFGNGGFLSAPINGGTLAFDRTDSFSYGGTFNFGTALRQVGSGTTVFNGIHNGTPNIEVAGGRLILANFNPVTTGATVTGGTLEVGGVFSGNIANAGTVAFNRAGFTYADVVSGSGGIVQLGGSTLLTSAQSYTGGTVVTGGTLQVQDGGALGGGSITNNSSLVLGPGGSLGSGALTNSGTLTISRNDNLVLVNALSGTGTIAKSGSGTLTLPGLGYAGGLDIGAGSIAIEQGIYAGGVAGAGKLTKNGTGTVVLTGGGSHSGTTEINAGTLQVGAAGGIAASTRVMVASGQFDLAGYDTSIASISGGGGVDLGSGRLTLGATGVFSSFWGNISGTGGLTVAGGGLSLSGNNTYTGETRVLGGSLGVSGAGTLAPGHLLVSNATFSTSGNLSFNATRTLALAGDARLEAGSDAEIALDATLTGDATLHVGGAGTLALNATPNLSGGLILESGTLRLGSGVDFGALGLQFNGGFLDLNGRNFSTPLTLGRGGLANSAAQAITVSSAVSIDDYLYLRSTGGDLRFTGTVTTPAIDPEADPVEHYPAYLRVTGTGRVAVADATASILRGLEAEGGVLAIENTSVLPALEYLNVGPGGTLELGGGSATVTTTYGFFLRSEFGLAAGLLNPLAGSTIQLAPEDELNGYFSFDGWSNDYENGSVILLGGAGHLELAGTTYGGVDLGKIGTGRLLLDGNYENYFGRFDVREGTLAADAGVFATRGVNLRAAGALEFLDAGDTITIQTLTGDGTLALGDRHFTPGGGTNFAGAIVTTGSVRFDRPGESAALGSVSAAEVFLANGDLTLNGTIAPGTLLHVDSPAINAAALRVAAANVTTDAGATFTGTVDTNGRIFLMGMDRDVTANAGSITLRNRDDESGTHTLLASEDFGFGVVQSLTSNSGTLRLQNGYSVFTSAQTFTNTGTVAVTGSHPHPSFPTIPIASHLAIGSGAGTVFNQNAGSLEVGAGAELAVRTLNVAGGVARVDGAVLAGSSGTLNLTGGELLGTGSHSGRVVIAGGTFNPGASVGAFGARDATLAGGQYRWEIADATGAAGTGWDVLNLTNSATVTATAADPFNFAVQSSGAVANFNPANNYTWSVLAAPGGLAGFAADKFAVDGSGFATATGNFGVAATATGLQLVYNWSHTYAVAGTQVVSDALAANGDFGGLRKQGTGTLVLTGNSTFTGTTHVDAGTLQIGDGGTTGSVAGDIANDGTIAFNRSDATTYAGVISGDGSLVKQGGGTLTLTGDHTYTGSTLVGAGLLLVNGSIGGSGVTIDADALLGGLGDIAAPTTVQSGGLLSPGTSPGTLTFTAGLTLESGSILNFELGTISDLIRVSGGTLAGPASGQVTINLLDSGGFGPEPANTYVLFDFAGASLANFDAGDFALGTTIAGFNYSFALAGSQFNLVATAIPEPSTYALFAGLAVLGWAAWQRRRKAPATAT